MFSVSNATFTFPSSPLLTQGGDVSPGMLCTNNENNNNNNNDDDDDGNNNETVSQHPCSTTDVDGVSDTCECVHVRHVPVGATVEIILFDQGN